jgi:hypothetical protein
MSRTFTLAVCVEILWRDHPIQRLASCLADFGFQTEISDWIKHDMVALMRPATTFSSMTGYARDVCLTHLLHPLGEHPGTEHSTSDRCHKDGPVFLFR